MKTLTVDQWNKKALRDILRFSQMLAHYRPGAKILVWLEGGKLYYSQDNRV